jgi:hypothetical protein
MEETLRHHLFLCVRAFERATDTTPATVGKRALNDNTFFARISEGQGFTVRTFDRVMEWLSANWPHDAEWPEGVERPDAREKAA